MHEWQDDTSIACMCVMEYPEYSIDYGSKQKHKSNKILSKVSFVFYRMEMGEPPKSTDSDLVPMEISFTGSNPS